MGEAPKATAARPKALRNGLFALGLLLAGAAGLGLCNFLGLDMDASYASYAEAEADGAVHRGWIPGFVPHSATDIRERHNLDTNEQWLTFRFSAADLPAIQQALKSVNIGDVRFPRTTHKRRWWPKDLRQPSSQVTDRYHFFSSGDTAFLAIDRNAPLAWYWSSP